MTRTRFATTLASAALLVLAIAVGVLRRPHVAVAETHMHGMTDASMARMVDSWYSTHPTHGGVVDAAAADTFLASNFIFNADNNVSTQVDTAKILTGQTILFKWVGGTHTTTSGNPGDLDAGSLWDHALTSAAANQQFSVRFDSVGVFPFFCVPHGDAFGMLGVVVVRADPAGVTPLPDQLGRAGFVAMPWPNPTHAGASFRFRLDKAGRALVRVYDSSGRAVATAVDEPLPAGTYSGTWDGRIRGGSPAPAGVYYLRLQGQAENGSRRIIVSR